MKLNYIINLDLLNLLIQHHRPFTILPEKPKPKPKPKPKVHSYQVLNYLPLIISHFYEQRSFEDAARAYEPSVLQSSEASLVKKFLAEYRFYRLYMHHGMKTACTFLSPIALQELSYHYQFTGLDSSVEDLINLLNDEYVKKLEIAFNIITRADIEAEMLKTVMDEFSDTSVDSYFYRFNQISVTITERVFSDMASTLIKAFIKNIRPAILCSMVAIDAHSPATFTIAKKLLKEKSRILQEVGSHYVKFRSQINRKSHPIIGQLAGLDRILDYKMYITTK